MVRMQPAASSLVRMQPDDDIHIYSFHRLAAPRQRGCSWISSLFFTLCFFSVEIENFRAKLHIIFYVYDLPRSKPF